MRRGVRRRVGFSLIEVIMSLTILAIVMSLLASLSLTVARRGRDNDNVIKRNSALAQQAGRYGVMSFTDLASQTIGTTTTLMLLGDFTFNRRVTISKPATNRYRINIVIAPQTSEFKPDSVTFDRTRPALGTPLCTTC